MKNTFLFIILLLIFSCGKDKIVQLPEIQKTEISEIEDISVAYLFYDETLPDSLELNRKNLISSTNWLVNIDKRLTLKQVIPQVKFLQEKKENAGHKNKKSKNYFTCNDTSKKNLGFIDFTEVTYHNALFYDFVSKNSELDFSKGVKIDFNTSNEILIEFPLFDLSTLVSTKSNFKKHILMLFKNKPEVFELYLNFNKNLTFQDYIAFKSILSELDLKNVRISNHEFVSY